MDAIIVTMLFGVLGIVIGWKVGTVWGASATTNRQYWLRNLAAVLIGIVLSCVVTMSGFVTLAGLAIGLIGGTVAGLKMGFGKSVGAWEKHDRFFRVNKDQVAASESAKRARETGMTEEEQAKRDLVSVTPGTGHGDETGRKGR